jgi:hypothetical protein
MADYLENVVICAQAAEHGHNKVFELLVSLGADVHIQNQVHSQTENRVRTRVRMLPTALR